MDQYQDNSQANDNLLEREAYVVGSGFGAGAAEAAINAWSGLQEAAQHPLNASGNFLKNHWQDALAGAAITFVSPGRWGNAALLAFSLRGVGVATFKAAAGAADAHANLGALHNQYKHAIGTEGCAFLSSLPLTIAGGMVGRSAANAVFGEKLGALDLLRGKVTGADVKANLWDIHDSIRPPAVKLVVTDMDNTLFPFSKYMALGLKKGIADMSVATGIDEDALYKAVGEQMHKNGSFNYPWSVELALQDKLKVGQPGGMGTEQFKSTVLDPFWNSVESSMREHGQAFPPVRPTLETLKERQIPLAVLTNATSVALKRLDSMGLLNSGLIDRTYALAERPAPQELNADLLRMGQERVQKLFEVPHDPDSYVVLPRDWEKPDPRGLQRIIKEYGLRPKQVLMVGDGVGNDIGVAQRAGTRGLLVRFPFTTPENEAVLDRLSSKVKAKQAPAAAPLNSRSPLLNETDSFAGVLNHLEPQPNYAATMRGIGRSLLVRPQVSAALGYGLVSHWLLDSNK